MTKRIEIARAPAPLEAYCQQLDPFLGKRNRREGFRQYLEGLLLSSSRHKTLTGLVNTEPILGAQLLQWFFSESDWDDRKLQAERLRLLREDATTTPNVCGVLVIDETGYRKDGHKTAHVGRQYLGNLGKIDNGVVSVMSLWTDERVYYPLEVEPYTPESSFAKGKNDPARPQLETPSSRSLHCPLLHQDFKLGGFVPLTSCQHKGHRFAFPFGTQMEFGTKTTLTFASCFLILIPPFAPAAC
jgi:hypothetical protein